MQAHPRRGNQARARQGGEGAGPPPPPSELNERSTAPGHEPRGTALLEPCAGTARAHRPGGGSGHCACTRAHKRKGHTRRTQRATGPSPRNAKATCNGVQPGAGKGHPGRIARDTHRGEREGRGRQKRGGKGTVPPPPRRTSASAAHRRPGQRTHQGSTGARPYAPSPRLGSLRQPIGLPLAKSQYHGPGSARTPATMH